MSCWLKLSDEDTGEERDEAMDEGVGEETNDQNVADVKLMIRCLRR